MEALENRPFSSLSGGEQQRVILARALAQRTEALILDEPTNHLDIKYQLQLLNIVKSMHKTVLSAFHDLNLAAMYSDVIYVVKDGQIYSRGTPREVLTEQMIEEVYGVRAKVRTDERWAAFDYLSGKIKREGPALEENLQGRPLACIFRGN